MSNFIQLSARQIARFNQEIGQRPYGFI